MDQDTPRCAKEQLINRDSPRKAQVPAERGRHPPRPRHTEQEPREHTPLSSLKCVSKRDLPEFLAPVWPGGLLASLSKTLSMAHPVTQ